LNGRIQDTNTRAIARLLVAHGLLPERAMTIADDPAAIRETLVFLASRCRFVVVSGGLGPTADDLTTTAAAEAFHRPLRLNPEAYGMVSAFFRGLGREMSARQEKQAWLPDGSTVLPNPKGSAPGFAFQERDCLFAFLPGVPQEMEGMMRASVLPRMLEAFPQARGFRQKSFTLFGLPESEAEVRLEQLGLPDRIGVAFCVNFPLVEVRLSVAEEREEPLLKEAALQVRNLYGDHLVAEEDQTLAGEVARLLIGAGKTLALAESCTGGWIAKTLTDIAGSSAFLERGAVTYANSAKRDWLGVSDAVLNGAGAVSAECALAMGRGMRKAAASHIALAVTGIAGPAGGSEAKPVGTVFIALISETEEQVNRYQFPGDRERVRWRAVCTALDLLRRHLLK
ncbi:MAG: CinA family nicotinamide mononucleotide deamidase-related protein, partial [Deltaproteobacteria bacterium]|nr:CinA family nicotinamide mononucleotide deamidase-related protein [Deltaproteobacteria bacterium]